MRDVRGIELHGRDIVPEVGKCRRHTAGTRPEFEYSPPRRRDHNTSE